MESSVSIVLITWNSGRFLGRCIEGIEGQELTDLELVVVDNGSADGSDDLIVKRIPSARFIRNGRNLGFAAAANQGISRSSAPFVLLLNPDVFLAPGYISSLVAALEEAGSAFGSATGKLMRGTGVDIAPSGLIDSKGIRMTRNGRHLDIGAGEEDDGRPEQTREVFGVSGAAALYRRAFLEDSMVDGEVFDSDFFAYREDADLAWRGRLFGWKSLYVPEAVAWHVRTVRPENRRELPERINMHSVKNRFLLRLKNEGGFLAMRNGVFELTRDAVVLGASLTIERASLPAFRWLWEHRAAIMKKRRAIQERRTVSDRALADWFGRS